MAEDYAGRKFKTVFVEKKTINLPEVEELISFSRKLAKIGFLKGIPGNYSIKTDNGFIITAGGVDKEKLSKEDLVLVSSYDKEKDVVYASGAKEPSSEARMHYMIYNNFPEVSAVVHVHDPAILENQEKAKSLGIVFTRKELPYGTVELAKEVLHALRSSSYVVMLNHGSVAIESSLDGSLGLILKAREKLLR